MECERFKQLLKSWYIQVQDEALAPARMVDFMEKHISECPTCIMDPEAKKDMTKIITLVLPKDKLKTTTRSARKAETPSAEKGDPEEIQDKEDDEETSDEIDDENDDDIDETDDDEDIEIDDENLTD